MSGKLRLFENHFCRFIFIFIFICGMKEMKENLNLNLSLNVSVNKLFQYLLYVPSQIPAVLSISKSGPVSNNNKLSDGQYMQLHGELGNIK